MTYMHWFLEEQSQDFRLSLADEYINGDECFIEKETGKHNIHTR